MTLSRSVHCLCGDSSSRRCHQFAECFLMSRAKKKKCVGISTQTSIIDLRRIYFYCFFHLSTFQFIELTRPLSFKHSTRSINSKMMMAYQNWCTNKLPDQIPYCILHAKNCMFKPCLQIALRIMNVIFGSSMYDGFLFLRPLSDF